MTVTIMGSCNASFQLNCILASLLKLCSSELISLLTKMLNLSLQQGQVPDTWKAALIRPLIKKLGLVKFNTARTSGRLVICLWSPN